MADETDVIQHEPFGIATRTVVLVTAGFLSLIVLALVLVGLMFGWMQVARGPDKVEMPVVERQPRLQTDPALDLAELRQRHEAQLREGPMTIEEAMERVATREDPFAPISPAEREEGAR